MIFDYDDLGRAVDDLGQVLDEQHGLWGLKCFNALSLEHQEELVVAGTFRGYGGGTCNNPAQIGIETAWDRNPAPRFYCLQCAIAYLLMLRREVD